MTLVHKTVLDPVSSFNETQFEIFNEDEHELLFELWASVNRDFMKFYSVLSPDQQMRVCAWSTQRTGYSTKELIKSLEKFTSYLKSSSYKNHNIYPKYKQQTRANKLLKKFTIKKK